MAEPLRDWAEDTTSVLFPLLGAGETIMALGAAEIESVNTYPHLLFEGVPEGSLQRDVVVALTPWRALFVVTSVKDRQIHTGVDAIAWTAMTGVLDPKPMLSAQAKFLNFGVQGANGPGSIKLKFFDALIRPFGCADVHGWQPRFHAQAAALANQYWQAGRASGQTAPAVVVVVGRMSRPVPVRPATSSSGSGAGGKIALVLGLVAVAGLGFFFAENRFRAADRAQYNADELATRQGSSAADRAEYESTAWANKVEGSAELGGGVIALIGAGIVAFRKRRPGPSNA